MDRRLFLNYSGLLTIGGWWNLKTQLITYKDMDTHTQYDAIIIGGSYAGLSAAMALGRSLRNVLVIDSGKPCNATTPYSHNFLTQDGVAPGLISEVARRQVEHYDTVHFVNDLAVKGNQNDNGFEITLQSGATVAGSKLIFATGIKDLLPEIPGFSDCWGISVIHCPYCHGYEFRQQKTAILANGDRAFHLSMLVNNLTKELTVLTNEQADFTPEQREALTKHGINIIEQEIREIVHDAGNIRNVRFANNEELVLDAMYAAVPFEQSTSIPMSLGCQLDESGYLITDPFQKTGVPGIFACGDNTVRMRSVANAVSSGNTAGAVVNMELTLERF